jgi:probable HAF family extracellular repeat protein
MTEIPLANANAINAAGDIAGYINNDCPLPVLFRNGQIVQLGFTNTECFNPTASTANGVNNVDHVVGVGQMINPATGNRPMGFFWREGQPTIFFAQEFRPRGINNSDQIAGTENFEHGHALLWQNGIFTDLGTLGGSESAAFALNDAGHVVGYATRRGESGVNRAFLWENGVMMDLGSLLGGQAQARGVNNFDQVVGFSNVEEFGAPLFSGHATIWDRSVGTRDLNALIPSGTGWTLNFASGINDCGQIVGVATVNGNFRAFLLTPGEQCLPGATLCGNMCSFLTDQEHCGACGTTCSGGTCSDQTCHCTPTRTPCDGTCVLTSSDPAHCGSCSNACASSQTCDAGVCM